MIAIPETTDLCRLAERHDTDKGTGYTQVYDRWLAPRRQQQMRMLEIGLYNGGSLRMWRDYLPNTTLHGIDIEARALAYQDEIDDCQVRLVDQADPDALHAFVAELGGHYDIVLDDGGHTMVQQVVSFEVLWPQVTPGGIYVIEDLATSYWPAWGGRGLYEPGTAVDFAKHLVDDVNRSQMVAPDGATAVSPIHRAQLRRDVASIHFHPGIALVVKAV